MTKKSSTPASVATPRAANRFQSWQSVKVTDAELEVNGQTGRVTSANEYDNDDGELVVDVLIDGDTTATTFSATQVSAIG